MNPPLCAALEELLQPLVALLHPLAVQCLAAEEQGRLQTGQ